MCMEDSKNGTEFETGYDEVPSSDKDASKKVHGRILLMETSEFQNKETAATAGNDRALQIVVVRTGIQEQSIKNRTGDNGTASHDADQYMRILHSSRKLGAASHDAHQHMRILHSQPHVARPKTKKIKCLKPKVLYAASSPEALNSGTFNIGAGGGGEHQCICCFKKFTTLKSLCGHMRIHPMRNWKGIRPSDPSSAASSAAHGDQLGPLPKWSRTGRRGRNSLAIIDLPVQPDDINPRTCCLDPTIISSALRTLDLSGKQRDLIRIENVEAHKTQFLLSERVASRKQMIELRPENENKSTATDDESIRPSSTRSVVQSKKANESKYELVQLSVDLEQPNRNVEINDKKMVMAMNMEMMRTNWKTKLRPFEPRIQKRFREYTCGTCGKTFQTFQALGGHRSSVHHKYHNTKKAMEPSIGILPKKDFANPMVQVKKSKELGEHASNLRICNICYKSFPTGQALVGHKKRHWAAEAARSAELARASSEPKAEDSGTVALTFVQSPLRDGATQAGRKVLQFDLNEPYVEEDN